MDAGVIVGCVWDIAYVSYIQDVKYGIRMRDHMCMRTHKRERERALESKFTHI